MAKKNKQPIITIKNKYRNGKLPGASYIKPEWDEVYLGGRNGEDPMQHDYARTITVFYNWRGLAMGERDWRG